MDDDDLAVSFFPELVFMFTRYDTKSKLKKEPYGYDRYEIGGNKKYLKPKWCIHE